MSVRSYDNISFIQQTIAPNDNDTRPPPFLHPSALFKQVTLNLSFQTVAPPANPLTPDLSTGLILFFPKDGVGSISHMGIVPKGHQVPSAQFFQSTLSSDADSTGGASNWILPAFQWGYTQNPLTYTRALALPRLETGYTISADPDLSEQFSRSRQYGAWIEINSSTISTGSTTLNGICSAAVVSDTRDICQNNAGDDCYAVVNMVQAARVTKEYVKNVDIRDGVVTVQGPDIPDDYSAPNAGVVDRVHGGWQSLMSDQVFQNPFVPNNSGGALSDTGRALFMAFISPWGVQCNEQNNGAGYPANGFHPGPTVAIPAIDEFGIVDVSIDTVARIPSYDTATGSTDVVTFQLVCEWVFAGITDSKAGTIGYQSIRVSKSVIGTVADFYTPVINANPLPYACSALWGKQLGGELSCASQYYSQGGYRTFGKMVGVRVGIQFFDPSPVTGQVQPLVPQILMFDLSVRARQIDVIGKVGPCHIIRYDDVGAGQNIEISGGLNTESVAKSNLAPFVQHSITGANYGADMNIMPLLYALYNSRPDVSPFKCSWARSAWYEFQATTVKQLSISDIEDMGAKSKSIASASQAAGVFSGLGSVLGQHLGNMVGHPRAGNALGSIAGSMLDSFQGSGAAGQFGSGAMGQFGSDAAGQFGSNSFSGMVRQRPW